MAIRQLFISDLDGTLLTPESRISDKSASIISHLSRQGALITVATARTAATVDPLMQHTYTTIPAITMTGAAMWDRQQRRFVDTRFIADDTAAQIIDTCRGFGLQPFIYTISDSGLIHTFFHGNPSATELRFIEERNNLALKRIHINERKTDTPPTPAILILVIGANESVTAAATVLRNGCQCHVSDYPDIFNPDIRFLEVLAPGVSKAAAVMALKQKVGADRLTVFGDNLNDLPMMAVADVAVAVANAQPEVKARAHVIIDSNAQDAVARYISEEYTKHI